MSHSVPAAALPPIQPPSSLPPLARRLMIGVAISAIGNGLTLPFLMVYLHHVRGISTGTAGLVLAWMGAVSFAVATVAGALVDRYGPRTVLIWGLLGQAAGVGLLAWVERPGQAFAVAAVCAAGGAGLWTAQGALLAQLAPAGQRPQLFRMQFMLLNLGIGVGGLVAATVVELGDVRTFQALYVLDALSYLGYLAVLLAMPGVGRVALRLGDDPPVRGGYREILADRVLLRVLACTVLLVTFGYAQLEAGFTLFATEHSGVPPRVLAVAFAANTGALVAGQLLVQRWLTGRSRSGGLVLVALAWAVAWVLLGLSGLSSARLLTASLILAAAVFCALGETIWTPTMPALVNDLGGPTLRGRYSAMHTVVWQLSLIIGPAVAGLLLGRGQAAAWIALTAAGCLLGGVLAVGVRRRVTPAQDGRARSLPARTATAGHRAAEPSRT